LKEEIPKPAPAPTLPVSRDHFSCAPDKSQSEWQTRQTDLVLAGGIKL